VLALQFFDLKYLEEAGMTWALLLDNNTFRGVPNEHVRKKSN
jgi:hypothetical protein